MRETRPSGSEGGAAQSMRRSYPYLGEGIPGTDELPLVYNIGS